ncbi:aldo/keto reductase [Salipaludibacillus daqingensis]|uniref:aldo/keto reductase n=1 Tax=Salipaludibacillus daqingensis TaxID=3041001 RepID=UPI002474E157|nr:aldo/keto reductase [Salipaludibacillus daqingensis]
MNTNQTIPLRRLGHSNLRISALGLGCWQFSKGEGFAGKFWPIMNQDDIDEIIKMSLEGGINWFDTAEVYGKGESEKALSQSLNNLNIQEKNALIATKWWPFMRGSSSITTTIEKRLEALSGRSIDLYQIHQPFSLSSVRAEMKAMAKLLRNNKIKNVGVSNFNEDKMREAHDVLQDEGYFLASNQVKYSLLDRRIENNGVLAAAKELGVTIIAYSPLEQGILSGKFHHNPELIENLSGPRKYSSLFKASGLKRTKPLIDLLEEMAIKYEVSVTQVALNWLIHYHGDTVVAIPGASKPNHAKENIGTLQFTLSEEDMAEIDKVSRAVGRF